ncbi:hypothetical protein GNT69_10595 [Bacillus sp. B15-48]|nr:hypothetical protein [Bacillus sp. B15-48]
MVYLYDPRTNISTPTTYKEIEAITGMSLSSLPSYKSKGIKLKGIDCYITDENVTAQKRKVWYEKETYPDEAWKTIKGSDGQFLISSYGRVKRVYKTTKKFLLPFRKKGQGNLLIKVRFNNRYGTYKVGHLVATHFIRGLKPGEAVVRKNGIITDDYVANLRICSKQELGRMTAYKAKSKEVVLLDPETNEVINEFRSAREAGRKTNFSYQAITDRCNKVYPYKNNEFVFMWSEDYERLMSG